MILQWRQALTRPHKSISPFDKIRIFFEQGIPGLVRHDPKGLELGLGMVVIISAESPDMSSDLKYLAQTTYVILPDILL